MPRAPEEQMQKVKQILPGLLKSNGGCGKVVRLPQGWGGGADLRGTGASSFGNEDSRLWLVKGSREPPHPSPGVVKEA